MEEKIILEGVFTEFNRNPTHIKKKLGKKIKGRKAIPNYWQINRRILNDLPENYTESEYNLAYIAELKRAAYTCKEFECGNISDSSIILLLSVDSDFDEYTFKGIFKLK